ncbi:MAG: hypothetical protein JSS47_00185 [Proteobacteria bacterium]|nr:hypothetical protein [Pseudomonadota bacterium]
MNVPLMLPRVQDCDALSGLQRGSALIMGLIMLLVMTMIGLTAMQTTTQQERMAGNLRDRNIAFQAAETALRRGESAGVETRIKDGDFSGSGTFDIDDVAPRAFINGAASASKANWENNSHFFDQFNGACDTPGTHVKLAESLDPPRYFVERQPPMSGASLEAGVPKTIQVFKVTSRGVGGSDAAVVVLQSSLKRQD